MRLKELLDKAISEEKYEEAAKLRDRIAAGEEEEAPKRYPTGGLFSQMRHMNSPMQDAFLSWMFGGPIPIEPVIPPDEPTAITRLKELKAHWEHQVIHLLIERLAAQPGSTGEVIVTIDAKNDVVEYFAPNGPMVLRVRYSEVGAEVIE